MNGSAPGIRIEKWPFVALGAFAVAIAIGGILLDRYQQAAVTDSRYAELTSIGQLKVSQISNWRAERLADGKLLSSGSVVATLVEQFQSARTDDTLRRIAARLAVYSELPAYTAAFVAAPDGRIVASAAAGEARPAASALAAMRTALDSRQVVLTDFYRIDPGPQICLDVVIPLISSDGRVIGALLLRSDPARSLYPLIASWPTPSATAETLLVRRDGNSVLFLNDLRFRKNAALRLRAPMDRTGTPAVEAVLGRVGRFEGPDYRGVPVLADIRPIPGSPWFMVAKIDMAEALAEARLRTRARAVTAGLLFLLAAFFLAYLTRRRQRNLYRLKFEEEEARHAELRRHQAELRESEERFRTTLYSIGDGVITTDGDGRVRQINPAAESLTGWTEEAAAGRPIEEIFRIVNEDTRQAVENPVRRVIESGTIVGLANHTVLVARDGTERPIDDSGAPIRAGDDASTGVVLVFRDQTAQRRAQARDRWLSSIVEQSLNEIYVLDAETLRFEYVSPGTLARLGYTFDEMRQMTPADLAPTFTREQFMTRVAPLLEGREARIEFEGVHRCKDGTRYDAFLTIQLMSGAGRRQFVVFALDVTARNRLEENLRQAQRMEAIGRLAGGVAHDFNNLLSVINNYADFGIEGLREGDALRDDLIQIREAGQRAAGLTRQLLAFGRKQIFRPESLDPGDVVTGLTSMLRRLIGEHVRLETSLAPGLWKVTADRGQLEQVLINLTANARDAMPEGGVLTIETSNAELDEQYVDTHVGAVAGRFVVVTVSDTGTGMDEATRAKIFEPFFTTKDVGKGTGLGLATVYGIVKQSGGNVWVYSEPGRGTTFKVYLPASPFEAVREAARETAGAISRGHETVLLVEDEPGVRGLAVRILRGAGYRVIVASNGTEALRVCDANGPPVDLLVTDVVMPEMSGRHLADAFRASWPDLKVLFMSGYTADAIAHHGVLEPGVDLLGKPFTASELTARVRRVLDGPAAGRADPSPR